MQHNLIGGHSSLLPGLCRAVIGLAFMLAGASSLSATTVVDGQVSPAVARDGQTVTLRYLISSPETREVTLEAHIFHSSGKYLLGHETERNVTLQPGTHWYERSFWINLGPDFPLDSYNIHFRLVDPGASSPFASALRQDAIEIQAGAPLEVPVLVYNKVGAVFHNWFWIETPVFAEQMRALHEQGYTTVTLDDVMAYRAGEKTPPAKPVVITFHAGYQAVLETVDPILERYGFTATLFMLAGRAGMTNDTWDTDVDPVLRHPTWDEVRALRATGRWQIESGSMHHVDFEIVGAGEARNELRQSMDRIEAELGERPRFAAYPYGHGSDSLAIQHEAWSAGYHAAFGVRKGVDIHDKFGLPRFDVHNSVHTNPAQEPEQWYFFGSEWLGRGSALPPPDHFEWYPDEIPASWAAWQTDHFTPEERENQEIAGELANPAGDGLPNLLKYALGLSPRQPALPGEVAVAERREGRLNLTFVRPANRPDIHYSVEVSSDLASWSSGSEYTEVVAIEDVGEGMRRVTVRAVGSENAAPLFMRLRVKRLP